MTTEPSSELSFKEMHTPTSSTSSLMADRADRPKTVYFHGGIGGAGNYRHVAPAPAPASDADSAASTHSRPPQPRRSYFRRSFRKNFSSGVGGAGNMHTGGEEAALTQIEEEARARARDAQAPKQWHVGIGGAGNKRTKRQESPSSDFSGSTGSARYSSEPLPFGAAEMLRRKILGDRWGGK